VRIERGGNPPQMKEERNQMRGGKRPRSGRPKGSPNKATAERQAAIAASGWTPLDIILENARWAHAQATQLSEQLAKAEPSQSAELFREIIRFRGLAVEWARFAAPYCHPRLAPVAHRHTNANGRPAQPVVNVYIHGNPRPEGAGLLSEPGDNIPDRRHFDDLEGEQQKKLPLVRSR
jgi:hypothetical protein